jgi:hypothetical protein
MIKANTLTKNILASSIFRQDQMMMAKPAIKSLSPAIFFINARKTKFMINLEQNNDYSKTTPEISYCLSNRLSPMASTTQSSRLSIPYPNSLS